MRRLHCAFLGGVCAAILGTSWCHAEESAIYLIEEDWELVIHEPDAATVSPQVTFFTSPHPDWDDTYFQLQLNYAADDLFSAGGFHVSAFEQAHKLDEARGLTGVKFTSHGDRIRWTSVMAVIDGALLFAVKDGQGQDWGSFGGPNYLVKIQGTSLSNLNQYQPLHSLDAIDIGFGANRVQRITLLTVRKHHRDGDVETIPLNLDF